MRGDPEIDPKFARFLASAYELKVAADYDGADQVSFDEAATALSLAAALVELIDALQPG